MLPLENLSGDASLDAVAAGTTEEIIRALVAFNIFATASTTGHVLESADLFALRKEFDAGYVLTGSVRSANGALRFALRLVDTEVGTQLWSRAFDEHVEHADTIAVEDRIGATTAQILSSPFGPVYGHEIARTAGRPAQDLDPYECLLRFYEYTRFFDPIGHADSLRCLQRAVKGEPRFAPAWSALARSISARALCTAIRHSRIARRRSTARSRRCARRSTSTAPAASRRSRSLESGSRAATDTRSMPRSSGRSR